MLWPAAALAVFVLGFAVVYGSLVQSRLAAAKAGKTQVPLAGTYQAKSR